MQLLAPHLRFSASDLVGHLDCHHLTVLDAAVARGSMSKPTIWDPVLETLADRSKAHKRQYVEQLKPDTLVQLFCLCASGLIGRRYEYERTRISRCALFIGIGVVNEQRTNRAEEL